MSTRYERLDDLYMTCRQINRHPSDEEIEAALATLPEDKDGARYRWLVENATKVKSDDFDWVSHLESPTSLLSYLIDASIAEESK